MGSSQTQVVDFPEEDESIGEFSIAWFGPDVNVYPQVSLNAEFGDVDSY
jgi:hypothetical protein